MELAAVTDRRHQGPCRDHSNPGDSLQSAARPVRSVPGEKPCFQCLDLGPDCSELLNQKTESFARQIGKTGTVSTQAGRSSPLIRTAFFENGNERTGVTMWNRILNV